MTQIDNRFIAFENDHTYLKTTYNCKEDTHILQTDISPVRTNNNAHVLLKPPSTDHQQKTVITTVNEPISKTDNSLNVPNPNIFVITDPLQFPTSLKINVPQDNLTVQIVKNANKSTVRPIQPKITNDTKVIYATQTQSNAILNQSTNTSLNAKLPNLTQKKQSKISEKTVVKPIKPLPNTILAKPKKPYCVIKHNIKAFQNKIVENCKNGTCTINLSSILLKRILNGETIFMCMECNDIYTEQNDLVDHQIIHNESDKIPIEPETEIRENSLDTNVNKDTAIQSENIINDNGNNKINKQTKPTLKSLGNPKRRKIVFQGECIICHSVFSDLGKHIKTVHQTRQRDLNKNNIIQLNYICYACDMGFDDRQQLRAHELAAHKTINDTYYCDQCCKDFTYKEELDAHVETHYNENQKYLCPYCDAGFPYSNGLRNHLVKHIESNGSDNSVTDISTNKIEYSPIRSSEQIDQLFADLENISEDANDVYTEHNVKDNYQVGFSTDVVKNTSLPLGSLVDKDPKVDIELNKLTLEDNNQTNIDQQQTTTVLNKRISYTVCRLCLMIVSYSRIGRHMKKKHNNAAPYQCEICHAEFNRKHIMDDHRRKHTNIKPHKCNECSKCFTYKHHLSRHMMIVHNSGTLEKLFKCSACDKAFSFKEYLTLHINSRHKGKHFMCQICGKNFSTNAALNKHQLCHTDERPYMCEHCGRTFKCKTHCDTHKKNMHPGDPQHMLPPEKFECNLCNKKFSTKVYRDMHFKRHNGQGHQCDLCFKLFVSKAHMQRHIKIMHRN